MRTRTTITVTITSKSTHQWQPLILGGVFQAAYNPSRNGSSLYKALDPLHSPHHPTPLLRMVKRHLIVLRCHAHPPAIALTMPINIANATNAPIRNLGRFQKGTSGSRCGGAGEIVGTVIITGCTTTGCTAALYTIMFAID